MLRQPEPMTADHAYMIGASNLASTIASRGTMPFSEEGFYNLYVKLYELVRHSGINPHGLSSGERLLEG